mmetsp:Transcript_81014/g.229354  ORF Transcript_81014/g.229354 Transcript_81014/m.229354 type:complete len:386 (+) Transcript_81014:92-1249(+)
MPAIASLSPRSVRPYFSLGGVDLLLESLGHVRDLVAALDRGRDPREGEIHLLEPIHVHVVASRDLLRLVVIRLDQPVGERGVAGRPVERQAGHGVDAPGLGAREDFVLLELQVQDARRPEVRLPQELRLGPRLGEAVKKPALAEAVDLVQALANHGAELLVSHVLQRYFLHLSAAGLLVLPQQSSHIHVHQAVVPGQGAALRRPAGARRPHEAGAVRAQGRVRGRADVQVAPNDVVDHVLIIIACADLDLLNHVLEELRDGDDVALVLLQPHVDEVLLLRGAHATHAGDLQREARADRLLARVQQQHLVQAEARLLERQRLRLDLRPRETVQDPATALVLAELCLDDTNDDVVAHQHTGVDRILQVFPQPEELSHVDVLDLVVPG